MLVHFKKFILKYANIKGLSTVLA